MGTPVLHPETPHLARRPPRQLGLLAPVAPAPSTAPPRGAPESHPATYPAPAPAREHWMAIDLPHLALEILARAGRQTARPLLVVETPATPRVHAANRPARRAGVRPGMRLADALAILDTPELVELDPEAMQDQIRMLAGVLLQFSDHVCPEPRARRLLLEAGRSQRLFGGLEALRRRVHETLSTLGFHPRIGLAGSPEAARLLAGLRSPALPADRDALRRTLMPVPLARCPLSDATREALNATGLRRFGDLLRLPRKELARRHGPELLTWIDRLLGDHREVLPRFAPAPVLDLRLRLEHEITATPALAFPLKRLLQQMEQNLRGRQRSLQAMTLTLRHRNGHTTLNLERTLPGIRAAEWLDLWQTRLQRATLQAPVIALELHADRLLDPRPDPPELLEPTPGSTSRDPGTPAVLARLRARLGETAVTRLHNCGTPLPEHALRAHHDLDTPAEALSPTPAQVVSGAALWLHSPQPVPAPRWSRFLGRLEDGWWSHANDQRRDYALARDAHGRQLWLYRCLRSGHWFRQGFWG